MEDALQSGWPNFLPLLHCVLSIAAINSRVSGCATWTINTDPIKRPVTTYATEEDKRLLSFNWTRNSMVYSLFVLFMYIHFYLNWIIFLVAIRVSLLLIDSKWTYPRNAASSPNLIEFNFFDYVIQKYYSIQNFGQHLS